MRQRGCRRKNHRRYPTVGAPIFLFFFFFTFINLARHKRYSNSLDIFYIRMHIYISIFFFFLKLKLLHFLFYFSFLFFSFSFSFFSSIRVIQESMLNKVTAFSLLARSLVSPLLSYFPGKGKYAAGAPLGSTFILT